MNKIRIKKRELLFCLAFGFFLWYTLLNDTLVSKMIDLSGLLMAGFIVTSLILCFIIIENKYHGARLKYLSFLAFFVFIGIRVENIRGLVIIALFIVAALNIDLDLILKESFFFILLFLIFAVVLYGLGFFASVDTGWTRSDNGIFRHSLGFAYTTYSANYFFSLTCIWVYLKRNSKKYLFSYVILFLLNYLIYKYTNTRVAFLETSLLLIFAFLVRFLKINFLKFKINRIIVSLIFVLCLLFSIWITVNFTNSVEWMRKINVALNYRMAYAHDAFIKYGINLLGSSVQWVLVTTSSQRYFYVDSSYIQIIIQYGIIVTIIIISLFTLLMLVNVQEGNQVALVVLGMIALHSITDPQLFNLAYNPFILSLGSSITYLYEHRKEIVSRGGKINYKR